MDILCQFRGLWFRPHASGYGVEVYDPVLGQWFDTGLANQGALVRNCSHVPDIALWSAGRTHLGTLRFTSCQGLRVEI